MSRWLNDPGVVRGADYDRRFAALAASGVDVHGEAAYVDALLLPGSAVLDAGCGTGRVAVELARRGHRLVGVDSDPAMLDAARTHDGVTWVLADLAGLAADPSQDLVVAAGNVVVFLSPGTGPQVVQRLAAQLVPGGLLVSGWRTDRLARETYDAWTAAAGLTQVARHAGWAAEPWTQDASWCVAVDRSAT